MPSFRVRPICSAQRATGSPIDEGHRTMAKSYYSTVLDHPPEAVWAVIRPFDHYAWAGVESETTIEAGKASDQISAVRRVTVGHKVLRQILLAHSDRERSYSYAF